MRNQIMRPVLALVSCYAGLSILTLAAVVLLRDDPAAVTDAVWVRGVLVTASSIAMLLFAISAHRGSARGLLRLRIVSAVMVVAIVVIIAIPGLFPLWLRIEQGVCGALMLAVVILVNRRGARAALAQPRETEPREAESAGRFQA